MQDSKKIALIVGIIGLIVCIPCFFIKDDNPKNIFLSIAVIYVLIVLLLTTLMFLYSYFNDFKIHPEFRQEAKTMAIYFFGALIVGFIFAIIFGGTEPYTAGDGTVYDNKAQLLSINTMIWTSLIMLFAAFVLSMIPLFKKKSNS